LKGKLSTPGRTTRLALKCDSKCENTACLMGCTPSCGTPSTWIEDIAFPSRRLARTEWKYLEFASPSLSHFERDFCQQILAFNRESVWISVVMSCEQSKS
jgi:hypothetical protein